MVEGARPDSAAIPAASTPKQAAAAGSNSANSHGSSFHESRTAESALTSSTPAMSATDTFVQVEKHISTNIQPVGVAHRSVAPSSHLIAGQNVPSKSAAAVSQQKKCLLSIQEIPNLVRHAPPPIKTLPVSNVHPLPRQFHQSNDYRPRKSSSANPHHRKGSTTNGNKQRSVSLSAHNYNNGSHGRNKHSKRRNSFAHPEEAHPFAPYQNAPLPLDRINGLQCPPNIPNGLMPHQAFVYNFPGADSDFSRPQTQRNYQGMHDANFGYLQPVPAWTRDNNRLVPLEIKKQQNGRGSHKRRQGVSEMDQAVRSRTYGTSFDENDVPLNSSNNRDSFVHNPAKHNAIHSNGNHSNPNSRHDHRYATEHLPYDSPTDGFQQQCRFEEFPQNTSNPVSSIGHQNPQSDKPKARHGSMPAHQPYIEVAPQAYDDMRMRRGSCPQDKDNFHRGLRDFGAPEKNTNYLTRKQVGYERKDAVLPSSLRNPRFKSQRSAFEYITNCHELDRIEYKNRNMNSNERNCYLRQNRMHAIDERIHRENYHRSSASCRSCSHPPQDDKMSGRPCCEVGHERDSCNDPIHCRVRTHDVKQNKGPSSVESTSSESSKSGDLKISNVPTMESKNNNVAPSLQARPIPPTSVDAGNSTSSKLTKRGQTEEPPESRRQHKRSTQAEPGETSTSDAQTSTLGLEIEEEMARARNMDIPVKFDSSEPATHTLPDPPVDTFVPTCRDANGNMFTIVNRKGMTFFHPQIQNTSNNSNYLIPVQINRSEEGIATTTPSMNSNSELPSHVVSQNAIDQSIGNRVPLPLNETPMTYPPQSNESSEINTQNANIETVFSTSNPAPRTFFNYNVQTVIPSPNLVFPHCDYSNSSPMIPVSAEQTHNMMRPNVASENLMMNNNLTSEYQFVPPTPAPGGPFAFLNSYTPPQLQNPTYDTPLIPSPTVAIQMSALPPDLNSPQQIQVGSLESTPPIGSFIAFPNQGVSQSVLVNQPSPQFSQVPISPFIQTTDQSQVYANASTSNSPFLYAFNQMTPSPVGLFPANAIPSTLASSENQQLLTSVPFQTGGENPPIVSPQSQNQGPIMNLEKQYTEMDNSPFDSNVSKGGETSAKKPSDVETNEDGVQKVNGDKITPKLIRAVLEKFILTVNHTQEKSCERLSSKELTDILCGKSERIIEEIKTKYTNETNFTYIEKHNNPETGSNDPDCFESKSTGEQVKAPEDKSLSIHEASQSNINAYKEESFPPNSENSYLNNFVNSAFPISFGFGPEIEGNSLNAPPVHHLRESESGESGVVLTPGPDGNSQFSHQNEFVNPHLRFPERRDSIGNVSVENRISFFEKSKTSPSPKK